MPRLRALLLLLLAPLLLLAAGALLHERFVSDWASHSHYEALGVASDAPPRAVKRAFRELSLRFHPDKSGGGDLRTRRFLRISNAYQVLNDPHARAAYDVELHHQPPAIRLTPPTRDWRDGLRFYAKEFPLQTAALVLQLAAARTLLLLLAAVGAALFAVDATARVTRSLWRLATTSAASSAARKSANDAAMRAARLRQQQALDTRRRHRPHQE